MKKLLYLLPAALLIFATACTEDDPKREMPDTDITLQAATQDAPAINAPRQLTEKDPNGEIVTYPSVVTAVTMPYDNGQEITYSISMKEEYGVQKFSASVRMIGGTAADVVIPAQLKWTYNGVPTTFEVTNFNLIMVGDNGAPVIGDAIKSITLCKSCQPAKTSSNEDIEGNFYNQLSQGKNLENIYLEQGYGKYYSINGCVYMDRQVGKGPQTEVVLVSVPKGRKGSFSVADGTQVIGQYAFNHCNGIEEVTLPTSVTAIENNAFVWTDLLCINILSATAPKAPELAFGHNGHKAVIRVTTDACKESCFPTAPVKPEFNQPAPPMPEIPGDDATEEEWAAYDEAEAAYQVWQEAQEDYLLNLKTYETDYAKYSQYLGYKEVKNVEVTTFNIQ